MRKLFFGATFAQTLSVMLFTFVWNSVSSTMNGQVLSNISAPVSIDSTSSNNLVVGKYNILHCVYCDRSWSLNFPMPAGEIKYTWSRDGLNWADPIDLGLGYSPTIAVDDCGRIGIAYIGGPMSPPGSTLHPQGTLYYRTKLPNINNNKPWSGTFQMDTAFNLKEPALAGHRHRMHLVAAHDKGVRYYTFKTSVPTAVQAEELIELGPNASAENFTLPSIAVARRNDCDTKEPIIRVGYYVDFDFNPGLFAINIAGVVVEERPVSHPAGNTWSNFAYVDIGALANSNPQNRIYSTSITANKLKGDFYFAYSMQKLGSKATKIVHSDRTSWSTPEEISLIHPYLDDCYIDVIAYQHRTVSRFKYAAHLASPAVLTVTNKIFIQEMEWDATTPLTFFPHTSPTPYEISWQTIREVDLVYFKNKQGLGINGIYEHYDFPNQQYWLESDYPIVYGAQGGADFPDFPPKAPNPCGPVVVTVCSEDDDDVPGDYFRGKILDPVGYVTGQPSKLLLK